MADAFFLLPPTSGFPLAQGNTRATPSIGLLINVSRTSTIAMCLVRVVLSATMLAAGSQSLRVDVAAPAMFSSRTIKPSCVFFLARA